MYPQLPCGWQYVYYYWNYCHYGNSYGNIASTNRSFKVSIFILKLYNFLFKLIHFKHFFNILLITYNIHKVFS